MTLKNPHGYAGLAEFRFVIVEANPLSLVRGPGVYDKAGKRIGQLIVEVADGYGAAYIAGRCHPDYMIAEMRIEKEAESDYAVED